MHTGHTIVHYLYKGLYETPPISDSVAPHKHNGLRAALLVFIAMTGRGLPNLQQLATQEIEKHGSSLGLSELLVIIDDDFPRLDSDGWVHEYLHCKAKAAFDQDHTVFSDQTFLQNLRSAALIKFMAKCVVDLYSTKVARMINTERSVSQPESPRDPNEQDTSQIGKSPGVARTTSRISSVASEISVEQYCEASAEDAALSDSFNTISCSAFEAPPEASPLETDPCPEPSAEDDHDMPEHIAVSVTSEACEAVDEPWLFSEQATEAEPEAVSDSPCSVEEAVDESVTMPQEWSAVPYDVPTGDIVEVASHVGEQGIVWPCYRQTQHILMGAGWKSCVPCSNVVRRLAGQVT